MVCECVCESLAGWARIRARSLNTGTAFSDFRHATINRITYSFALQNPVYFIYGSECNKLSDIRTKLRFECTRCESAATFSSVLFVGVDSTFAFSLVSVHKFSTGFPLILSLWHSLPLSLSPFRLECVSLFLIQLQINCLCYNKLMCY